MKLSQYAKQQGISYSTALRWWHQGVIRGYQAPSGTIIVETESQQARAPERVVIYARVSSTEHKENLERQITSDLAELRPGWSEQELQTFHVSAALLEAIERLEDRAIARHDTTRSRRDELRDERLLNRQDPMKDRIK